MERILNVALTELKEELDEPVTAANEPSRLMRLVHLKYKCFIVFVLGSLAALSLVYLTMKDVLQDEELGKIMSQTFDLVSRTYFQNKTEDVSAEIREINSG